MQVTLKHIDLVRLVCGISPSRAFMPLLQQKGFGTYFGSYDRWEWAAADYDVWASLTDEELWGLYTDTAKS